MAGSVCDVCLKNEAIGVFAIPGVPMSVAYCKECWKVLRLSTTVNCNEL